MNGRTATSEGSGIKRVEIASLKPDPKTDNRTKHNSNVEGGCKKLPSPLTWREKEHADGDESRHGPYEAYECRAHRVTAQGEEQPHYDRGSEGPSEVGNDNREQ